MKLDNFKLEEYNDNKLDHKKTILEIASDGDGRMYLGNLKDVVDFFSRSKEMSPLNHMFIAYYNGEAIGFITISDVGDYEICSGIRPKYRGEHFGALLLQEFSEKLFENFEEIDELKLYIDDTNMASIKTAKLVGYEEREKEIYSLRRM